MSPALDLRVRDLQAGEGGFRLEGVSFDLAPGGRLALIGPNGAGKSTLLRALSLALPSRGVLEAGGQDLRALAPRRRARRLALLPQQEEGGGEFRVEEFVQLGRWPHLGPFGRFSREDRQRVDWALQVAGCAAWRHRRLDSLSGGERQLARLAAVLAQEARVLLLDEPAAFLDPGQRRQLWDRLEPVLAAERLGLVFVTHDLNEALRRADQVLALAKGRPVRQGPVDVLEQTGWLGELFGLPLAARAGEGGRSWIQEAE